MKKSYLSIIICLTTTLCTFASTTAYAQKRENASIFKKKKPPRSRWQCKQCKSYSYDGINACPYCGKPRYS